jgi:predicted DNA-binding transcriptional regulator YafY
MRRLAAGRNMTKRPDNLETVRLTLELLQRIPRTRKISATELHVQLTNAGYVRDLRTIQRQLNFLSEHFDIERDDSSKPFGYRWKEKAAGMSVPMLSEHESLLLTLAEQQLRSLLPTSLMKSMASFFEQARLNLGPHGETKKGRAWMSKVRVVSTTQPLLAPKISIDVFEAVSQALYEDRWLEVEYKNADGWKAQANVMPLGLAQQGARLYLVCRYDGYDNERILALNRMLSARASIHTFERPKDFDLAKYDAEGQFGFGDGKQIRLTFRIQKTAGRHLLESPLSSDQESKEIGDELEISATVVDTEQLEWWLRGFGDSVSKILKSTVS